jgi:hypothetical protein
MQKAAGLFHQSEFWIGCGTLSTVICIAAVKRRLECDRRRVALNQQKLENMQKLVALTKEVEVYDRALAAVQVELHSSESLWAGRLRNSVLHHLNQAQQQRHNVHGLASPL